MARYDIYSGIISSGLTLSYQDYMYISSGGTANSITVNDGGYMYISSGGTANNTTVNSWGDMYISSGGTANNTTVNSGVMYITSGGKANSTTVDDGNMLIYSGGTANSTTVNGGFMQIDSGGKANSTTVDGGNMLIYSGGTATNVIWTPCVGYVSAADGAYVTYASKYSGVYFGSNNQLLSHTQSMSGKNVSGYGCSMYVMNGGTANNTTVNDWGYMYISSGGTANSTTVNSEGGMIISSGGTANSTTVNSEGGMIISAGGTATNIVAQSGALLWITVAPDTYIQGTYAGSAFEMKNAFISGYTVDYGYMIISSGGTANSTTVNPWSFMYISSGGTATNIVAQSGACLCITVAPDTYIQGTYAGSAFEMKNAFISGYTVDYGYMIISSGGTANSTTVNLGGYMYIESGGTANSTTVNSGGGMYIYSGGMANNTTVDGGYMYIYSGGTANSTTVNSRGSMYISSGRTANYTTVNSGSEIHIFYGGTANNTTVNDDSYMLISSGGKANSATVNSGGNMGIFSGGTATNIVAQSGAGLYITVARDTYIQGTYAGSAFEMKNAYISDFTVNSNGYMDIYSGGTVNDTTVKGGGMYIFSGGTANSTTVNSDGYMDISSGGIHRGSLQIGSGAYVSAGSGATVDFTVSEWTTSAGYLINNLSLIQGTPTYTITVKKNQKAGTYKLAQGADNFSGSITIGNGTVDYGTITVNGADFVHNGVTYSLDNVSGNLTLTVSGNTHPDGDLDGNGYADTVLVNTKQGYSGAWMTTGTKSVILWSNLGNVNEKVELVGMGNVKGTSTNGSDIIMKIGTTVAAWTTENGKVKSYKELYTLKSNMNMLGISDFDGDGVTDYLLRSKTGDLGYVTGDDNKWHYIKGLGTEWKIAAVGDLDGNGTDDVIVRHDAGFTGAYMIDTNGKITWSNLDTLKSDMTIVGTGDFNGDGVDDVLLQNKSNGWVGAWLVENGNVDSFIGICKNKNAIEQIADFNGDGIDDLRIRTDKGDIGVLYVKGADTTEWKYFQSVGKEWDTSFALIS